MYKNGHMAYICLMGYPFQYIILDDISPLKPSKISCTEGEKKGNLVGKRE